MEEDGSVEEDSLDGYWADKDEDLEEHELVEDEDLETLEIWPMHMQCFLLRIQALLDHGNLLTGPAQDCHALDVVATRRDMRL